MLAILGAIPEAVMSRKKIYLLHILFAAAKKAITLSWLKNDLPTYDTWQSVVKGIYTMEKNDLHAETAKYTIHRPMVTLAKNDGGGMELGMLGKHCISLI